MSKRNEQFWVWLYDSVWGSVLLFLVELGIFFAGMVLGLFYRNGWGM